MRDISPNKWQRIEEIFDEVLEIDPIQRLDFLTKICDGDEELKQMVIRLLESNEKSANFIKTPALQQFSTSIDKDLNKSRSAKSISHSLSIQETLPDHFNLESCLGKNIGATYKVLDKNTSKLLALKDISRFTTKIRQDFITNFDGYVKVTHPNLVKLYELFSDNERTFFTMALVNGMNCLSYLRKFAQTEVCSVLKAFAEGLAALHSQGKLHGNIKPNNILANAKGSVVTTDFGLILDPNFYKNSNPLICKEMAYIAPEQASQGKISEASDLYSLGVVLYEALTGQLPFAGSYLEMLINKRRFSSLPPSNFVYGIPVEVDKLCQGLLSPNPKDRPTGMEVIATLAKNKARAKEINYVQPSAS